jgi:hypothetical protein
VRGVAGARAGSRVPSLAITLGMVRLVRDGWADRMGAGLHGGRTVVEAFARARKPQAGLP